MAKRRAFLSYLLRLWLKQQVMAILAATVAMRARFANPRAPLSNPHQVLVLESLGLGDLIMLAPCLGDLRARGALTVLSTLPNPFDGPLDWRQLPSPDAVWREARSQTAKGGALLLAPRYTQRGLWRLAAWPGRLPPLTALLSESAMISSGGRAVRPPKSDSYADKGLEFAALAAEGRLAVDPHPPLRLAQARPANPPGEPFFVCAPWVNWDTRRWPAAHWAALLDKVLAEDAAARVIFLGGQAERTFGEDVRRAMADPARVDNRMGMTSLAEAAWLAGRAAAVFSCDSGLMHVAMAARAPTVAIFGCTKPSARLHAGAAARGVNDVSACPTGRAPCHRDLMPPVCPTAIECLTNVTPDMAYSAWRETLASR